MKMRKKHLAAAVALAGTLVAADQAAASVYAGSQLLLQNLDIDITENGGNPVPPGPITNFDFTATNTATLNGNSSPVQTATCGGLPPALGSNDCGAASPRLQAPAANAPVSDFVRAANDFSFHGPTAGDEYAGSAAEVTTAQLTGDATTSTQQIAEVEIQAGTGASANSEIQSITTFSFQFTVQDEGEIAVSFEADPDMYIEIDQDSTAFTGFGAQANMTWTLALTNEAGDGISWDPQGNGIATNNCDVDGALAGTTCVETADEEDLNRTIGTGTNPNGISYSDDRGASPDLDWSDFGIQIAGLSSGLWTLTLTEFVSVQVSQDRIVPTPTTLLLMGAGFAAVGLRKRKKAAKV